MDKTFSIVKQIAGNINVFNKRISRSSLEQIRNSFVSEGGIVYGTDTQTFSSSRVLNGVQEKFAVVTRNNDRLLTYHSFRFIPSSVRDEEVLTY